MDSLIYMDHHATTPADRRVVHAMLPFFEEDYGNAASRSHAYGTSAREAVDRARAAVADLVRAKPDEVIFTSGATESDNLAIKGVAAALRERGRHIITQRTEHRAVLDSCKRLESEGFEVTYLEVDAEGRIDPLTLSAAIGEDTILVSIMLANNEVGTVHDVASIGAIARERGVVFHCDAAQGVGYLGLDAEDIDLISLSAHKMYGPKGVGALIVNRACQSRGLVEPMIDGGGHESGLRSGTLNVSGIIGFAEAASIMSEDGAEEARRIAELRDVLKSRLLNIEDVKLNGSLSHRHPGNLNLSFGYVDGAALLLEICKVVAVSSGSACSSAVPEGSYVLDAMGVPKDWAAASIRFGLGRSNTKEEVERVAAHVTETVERLRKASPHWKMHKEGKTVDW